MKKALAVLLSVLVAFSMFSVMAFAAEGDITPITVQFVDNGKVIQEAQVKEGTALTPYAPENPSRPDTETTRYIFEGWQCYTYNEAGALVLFDETLYQKSTLRALYLEEGKTEQTYVYDAVYTEKDISGRQSLLNFFESIFERINMIFAYFAKVFGF